MAGPLSNTLVFGILFAIAAFIRGKFGKFPQYFYKVICWLGVFAILDPYIVFLVDIVTVNWVQGDMFKFYHHFEGVGDSGVVGAYISAFLTFVITIVTSFIWYRYMIGYYMNGRIIDLYRRLSGQYKAFFIPIDNEVSLNYLKWVITRAKKKNNVIMSEKRPIKDKYGKPQSVNFINIFKVEDGLLKKNRIFFKDYDGSVIEVPTKKVLVKQKELRKLKKAFEEGDPNNGIDKSFKSKNISNAMVAHGYGEMAEVPITDLIQNTKNFQEGNPLNLDGSQPGSPRSPRMPPAFNKQDSEPHR